MNKPLCRKWGLDIQMILDAIALLRATGKLPAEYHPHPLKGDHKGQIPEQTRLPVAFGSATSSRTG